MRFFTLSLLCLTIGFVATIGCERKKDPPRRPAETAQVTLRTADGLRIAHQTLGEGTETLLFIHGWSCSRSFWRHQLYDLADDYRIFAIDLPGHGDSDTQRQEWSVETLGADVAAVIEDADLDRVILVGHSMGGPVALAAAALAPERVIGVIGVDTLHNVEFRLPEEAIEGLIGQFERDFDATLEMLVSGMLPPETDASLVTWITDEMLSADPEIAIPLFDAVVRFDQAAALGAAGVPVRCINAAPRPGAGMPTAVETNRSYADFDVVLMEGVGHFPMLEQPEEFNSHLRAVAAELSER